MPDREKVITGLELCTNISPDGCLMLCPYKDEKDETYSGLCEQVLKQDALSLLKEQEAVKIEVKKINGSGRNGRCPNCLIELNEMDYPYYCGYCGQAVKWE